MKRTISFDELINKENTYVVVGNIRSKKPFLYTERLPFGYSVMISHFNNGKVVLRLNVRTPNGIKTILELPLNDGLFERRAEALKFALTLAQKIKEKYNDRIKPFKVEKQVKEFDLDQL